MSLHQELMSRRISGPQWDAWELATLKQIAHDSALDSEGSYTDVLSMMMSLQKGLMPRRINGPQWDEWELATLKKLASTDVLSDKMHLLKTLQAQLTPPASPTTNATAGNDHMQALQQLKRMPKTGGNQQFDSLLFLSQAYAMGDEEALAPISLGPSVLDDEVEWH